MVNKDQSTGKSPQESQLLDHHTVRHCGFSGFDFLSSYDRQYQDWTVGRNVNHTKLHQTVLSLPKENGRESLCYLHLPS